MKNYYSDYVGHMMRQYLKLKDEASMDAVARQNVDVCIKVISALPEQERSIIEQVYSSKLSSEFLETVSDANGIRLKNLWVIIKNFEKEIATERGLI